MTDLLALYRWRPPVEATRSSLPGERDDDRRDLAALNPWKGSMHEGRLVGNRVRVGARRCDVDVVVFGRTPAKLEQVRDRFGFATTTDLDGVYADSSFDLIDICLPTALHSEHALRALTGGKHVLCELPLALSMTDAHRVADAAADSDRQVFVDMAGRFSPAYRLLRDAVDDGTYGRPQALELELRSALLWPGYDLRSDTSSLTRSTASWTPSSGCSACPSPPPL